MLVHSVTPILNVSDCAASFAWFERFGWRKLWDWGEPATFGAVGNGACEIFVCQNAQGGRGEGLGVWMSIFVDDMDEVHRSCVDQGLDVVMPPTDEPWGVREMHVRHPDGHIFRVGTPVQHDHDHPHDHDHLHDHDHPHGHEHPDPH